MSRPMVVTQWSRARRDVETNGRYGATGERSRRCLTVVVKRCAANLVKRANAGSDHFSSLASNSLYATLMMSKTLSAMYRCDMSPPACETLSGWMMTKALW